MSLDFSHNYDALEILWNKSLQKMWFKDNTYLERFGKQNTTSQKLKASSQCVIFHKLYDSVFELQTY